MASDLGFVEFIVDQMEGAGEITYKKMFGEYGLYCDGTIMALICNDQLFIKPTEAGRSFIKHAVEAPPYPGGCPWSSERHDGPRIAGVITPINLKAKKGQSI